MERFLRSKRGFCDLRVYSKFIDLLSPDSKRLGVFRSRKDMLDALLTYKLNQKQASVRFTFTKAIADKRVRLPCKVVVLLDGHHFFRDAGSRADVLRLRDSGCVVVFVCPDARDDKNVERLW